MNKNKILVTGATGLLGPYIVSDLISRGYEDIKVLIRSGELNKQLLPFASNLTVVKGDVLDLYPLDEVMKDTDYVIHVAAMVSFDPKEHKKMYQINVDGTANIVNLCLNHNVKKLLHISSVAAIGRSEKNDVITEKTQWSNSKFNPYYGLTKYKSELEVWRGYSEGLSVVIINPSIILGQGDYNRSSLKMVKLIKRGLSHYPIGKVGIVDARDVAEMSSLLLESEISGERYIATATSITYKELFSKMADYLGVKPPKRPISPWLGALLWRLEKVRAVVSGSSPIVTKETIASSSYSSEYNIDKSLSISGFKYRNIDQTIKYSCEGLLEQEVKN